MDISIIIPADRDRGWLNEAIESALCQDYPSFEIILASDGNPDLKKYADRYSIRYSEVEKGNLSRNQNAALKIANGEFIKGLAEDDLLYPDCLTNLKRAIGDHALVYARALNFGMGKEFSYTPPSSIDPIKLWKKKSSFIHGGTTMFRKDAFWAVGGRDEKINSCEDYDFYLNLLSHGYTFTYCDKIVYKYRLHGGQKSRAHLKNRQKVKDYLYKKYEKSIIRSRTQGKPYKKGF